MKRSLAFLIFVVIFSIGNILYFSVKTFPSRLPLFPFGGIVPKFHSQLDQKMDFIVFTFYTNKYEKKAQRLFKSCEDLGIPYTYFELVFEHKSSHTILALKPQLILSVMEKYQVPVLFLDSDMVILQYPYIFTPHNSSNIDFMGPNWHVDRGYGDKNLLTSSGISWWNNTPIAKECLRSWANSLRSFNNMWTADDQVMDLFFNHYGWRQRLRIKWLELKTYLALESLSWRYNGTVIWHPEGGTPHGHPSSPRLAPKWLIETGKFFNNTVLIGGACGSYDVPNFYHLEGFDLGNLNLLSPATSVEGDLVPALNTSLLSPSCSSFFIEVHSLYLRPIEGVIVQISKGAILNITIHAWSSNLTSLGCWKDKADKRQLNQLGLISKDKNSPQLCASHCDGFTYFGLQYVSECWCGNQYRGYGSTSCGTPNCPGDADIYCGAGEQNHVFQPTYEHRQVSFNSTTKDIFIDLSSIPSRKRFQFEVEATEDLQILSWIPIFTDPPELTEVFEGTLTIQFSSRGHTVVYAKNVKLSGIVYISVLPDFAPQKGEEFMIMHHMAREGEFDSVSVGAWLWSAQLIYYPHKVVVVFQV